MISTDLEQRVASTTETYLQWIEQHGRQITPDGRVGEALAADLVGASAKTLRSMRGQGLGPTFHKTAGRVTYRVADLALWIERGRQPTLETLEL
ncbi:hypothetical protein [Castellaniella sp.]|uniref:hypothetical protein n=1 Tax=Castellaniella sp. TaxID=1955812 RepID=UPI002AFEA7AB|nr:hypothetical protein [Castellaniella sp.]